VQGGLGMLYGVPDWFFYTKQRNTQTHTTDYTGNFDDQAYLEGKADFWRRDDLSEKRTPKKILLCDWTCKIITISSMCDTTSSFLSVFLKVNLKLTSDRY